MADYRRKGADMQPVYAGSAAGDAGLAALADAQYGVVAHRQLVELGYGRGAIKHRIAIARLHPIHKGVYAVGRRHLPPSGYWMAAVLACGPDALLSHQTAAALWDLRPTNATKVDVTVPGDTHRKRPGLKIHRTATLHPDDHATLDHIPVTSVARTILDLATTLTKDRLTRVIEEAVRQNLFNGSALDQAIERNPRRKGLPKLRAVLATYRDPPPVRSELERRFLELIRRHPDIPEPQVNVMVAGVLVDIYWPDAKLVVELDSRGYHDNPRQFEEDRIRDAILQRARCAVLRVTDRRMKNAPLAILEDVRALRPPRA